ncbi:MAG: recombinase family protein [Candidatus Tectomicrobia bacterium]|nr:recombinase family protein [Candidatus Tectomicrobia bacterium]
MYGYVLYCRKSSESEDRQVLSIESQINELKQLAQRLNLTVTDILTEAQSAKAPGRPIFNALMQRIYKGEAKGVLCWKLDRLARNPIDGAAVIWAIKQHNIEIVTPSNTYRQQDENTILMYIEFGMAQKYIDDLSKNVKRGLKTKAEHGWFPGPAPLGYLNHHTREKGACIVIKDPERFPLVRKMWDLMLIGLSTPPKILELANHTWGFRTRPMNKLGGKPLARSGIYRLLTDPFYYGWFEYPKGSGAWYQGNHEPMITQEEYDRVQVLLGHKGRPRPIVHTFAFTGLIRCGECGAMVTAEEKHQLICSECRYKFAYRTKDRCPRCQTQIDEMRDPRFLHYTYYHCTKSKDPHCTQGSIEVNKLEQQIDAYLSRLEISERFKDWAITYLHEIYDREVEDRNHVLRSQQQAYQDCLKRLDNLVKLKTSPQNSEGSLLSDEEYGRQRVQLLKEKARLEELFQDTGHRVEQWLELAEKTFAFACSARAWFAQGDLKTKKEMLSAIGSNLVLQDKQFRIEAKHPFAILEKSLSGISVAQSRFEPASSGFVKRKEGVYVSPRPTRLPKEDDVRTCGYEKVKACRELVRNVFHHIMGCETICPVLLLQLRALFRGRVAHAVN